MSSKETLSYPIKRLSIKMPRFSKRRVSLLIYLAFNVSLTFSIYTYNTSLFAIARDKGATTMVVAIIGAVYGLTQTLARIPMGIISDYIKKRKLFLVIGAAFSLLSAIGLCMISSPYWLILWRALAGFAIASWVISIVLFISYFPSQKRPKALGILSASNSIGVLAGMLFGGIFIQAFGYYSSFILSLIGGALTLVLSLTIKEVAPENPMKTSIKDIVKVGKNPRLIGVSLLALVITLISFGTVYGFTPIFAKDNFGCNPYQLGLLGTISVMGMICANLFLANRKVIRRISIRDFIIVGFLFSAVCNAALPLSVNLFMLFVTQFFSGIGQGFATNALLTMSIYQVDSSVRSSSMGFYQSISGIGIIIGPIVVAALSNLLGSLSAGFYTLAASAGICALLSLFLPRIRNY